MKRGLPDHLIVRSIKAHIKLKIPLETAYEIAWMQSPEDLKGTGLAKDKAKAAYKVIHEEPPVKEKKEIQSGVAVQIIIDGTVYDSIQAAATAHRRSRKGIYYWLKTGRAMRVQGEKDAGQRSATKGQEARA